MNEDEVLLASEHGVIGPVKLSEMDNLVNAGLVERIERDGTNLLQVDGDGQAWLRTAQEGQTMTDDEAAYSFQQIAADRRRLDELWVEITIAAMELEFIT